jgi:plastocyanin
MRRRQIVLLAGLLLWMPAAAGLADSLPAVHVTIHDHAFVPRVVRVKPGQQIVWLNTDQDPHTVTSGSRDAGNDRWKSSPVIADGQTFALRLKQPGTYPYFCKIHQYEDSMHGTIIVSP